MQLINQATKFHKEGKLQDAERLYHEVLKIQPTDPNTNLNLSILLHELGRLDESEKCCRKAIKLKPDFSEAYHNLGIIQKSFDRYDEAEISIKKAIELEPHFFKALINLGSVLQKLGKLDDAEDNIKKALKIKPDFAEGHSKLGILLAIKGKLVEAEESYKKAIVLKPDFIEPYNNLNIILRKANRLLESEIYCRQAIEFNPDFAEAYYNLGNTLRLLGKKEDSLKNYKHAYALKPDIDFLFGSLVHTKMQLCIWDDLSNDLDKLTKKINNNEKVISPFALLSLIDDPSIHKKASEINSNYKFPKLDIFPIISPYHNHKKIRIGYFSPDFKNHPVSYLIAELFEVHDRSKFEIHAFSFGQDTKDEFNIRIKAGVDHFHNVLMMSNYDVVKLARSLEIDIAIDLAGLTGISRQGIFSMSAAPIQASYLGFNGTMCANYINYVIVDRIVIPENQKINYSEKIVYLPNSYMPNDSKTKVSKKKFTRKDFGLPDTSFVLCCFNQHYKINPTTFASWMNILSKVEQGVLWLSYGNSTTINNLKKEAKKFGINEDRLIFAPYLSLSEEHLERIKLADLFIDTLPFNAHATASDALRMGLPVLTCIGNSFAGRVAASLLTAVNLPEMITATQEEYEALAIQLATHPEKLKVIKDKLANNLPTAPLYDTSLYTRNLEAAYQIMYKRYQDGLDPNDIEIDS